MYHHYEKNAGTLKHFVTVYYTSTKNTMVLWWIWIKLQQTQHVIKMNAAPRHHTILQHFFAKVFLAKSLCSSFNKIRKWVVLVQNLLASIKSTLWSFHLSPLFLCQLADLQLLACVFRAIHSSIKPSHVHFIEPWVPDLCII